MCSSRLKHSFRIDDILNNKPKTDHVNKNNRKNANDRNEPERAIDNIKTSFDHDRYKDIDKPETNHDRTVIQANEKYPKKVDSIKRNDFNANDAQMQAFKLASEERLAYPTMPLVPTPLKPEVPWACGGFFKPSFSPLDPRSNFYFSESLRNPEHYIGNSLLTRRCTIPPAMSYTPYGMERGGIPGYWASYLGYLPALAKRKGGQVRFTSQQTSSLERRFSANKYLSPEERRLLAQQLKLSDRQVKTWFQNRRAKWRRVTGADQADGDVERVSDDEPASEAESIT